MTSAELDTAAAQVWAEALGYVAQLPGEGAHLVPGGVELHGLRCVHMASFGRAVFVYCPNRLRSRAAGPRASPGTART